ncbi:MAG: choice-of-anchor D domain-containing protein [Flaviramulus sp.]|nr:choice-of-anchor D domain-containing protein [Flaviramulus sp.]
MKASKLHTWLTLLLICSIHFSNNVTAQEIKVLGNNIEIIDNDNSPSTLDYTDYGSANLGTLITRNYTISNTGSSSLNIYSITISNTTDFNIISTIPTSVNAGSTKILTITFNSFTLGTKNAIVTINNNDSNESVYNYTISARAEQNFFDSDGDGILDNVDIDDDNDGISDFDEELACKISSISTTSKYKYLNETFGEGNRTTINTTYDAITTYCYENGTSTSNSGACPSLSNISLNDGEYTVYYKAGDGDGINDTPNGEVASWADAYWYTGEDHTPGDTNGRMAMFNASYDPGTFYTATIIGALPNIPITYSFWVLNLDTTTAPGIATRLRPNILVQFRDVNNNVLASITTGDIPPSINGDPENSWHQFTADLTFNVSEFYVYFINNEVGGSGNDLAIDDIVISQTLCDTDSDGVADIFDLDSDNDGIPDVVEVGLGNYSEGTATLTGCTSWVDTNYNGMHDLSEGHLVLDSDGDGTPNYLDLDSDNDTVFDVDESGAGNTSNPNFINGDGDITGDGVGDGLDTDTTRETDLDSDGVLEYYTDGILDLYDYYDGVTFSTSYGNSNQGSTGTGWNYYVKDSDNDGTPDYLDITSDGTRFDISKTLYANLDLNNDGVIDDTLDSEGDGIIDLFDTNDNVFGSPRDLSDKFQLYFDGRNDYADDTEILSGLQNTSIMGWIKIDPELSVNSVVFGQTNLEIKVDTTDDEPRVYAIANGVSIANNTETHPIVVNKWYHLAAVYDGTNNSLKMYLNGENIASTSCLSSALDTNNHAFTIGKSANPSINNSYFKGFIDEVRVFNKSLTSNELQKMVYQEIENNSGIIRGTIIPKDIYDFDYNNQISTPLNWSSLLRYYRLDNFNDDIIDDLTSPNVDIESGAKIYNVKIIEDQTAPLPHVTINSCSGNWNDYNNWENGNTPSDSDYLIVNIKGNIETNTNISTIGLILENGSKIEVNGDSGLFNSWYTKLDGDIDLQGESQFIQTLDSELASNSSGTLEKDQQGTADTFTYNYWSSPVGKSNNSTNNNSYKLPDVMQDVTFLTSGYNGKASPLSIADYWIWKFSNKQSDNYSQWQHVRSTGTLLTGEGFTMKGPGTGSISSLQNYIFNGKPNNADVNLNITIGNAYLIGNPYPSAIDAEQFILDNGSTIAGDGATTGIIYFWEHWGGGSHILKEYQGGYATYSLSGGVPAASYGTNDPDVSTCGSPTKIPGRYIPIAQGFFINAENSGIIKFNNGQRVFQVEDSTNSVFTKNSINKTSKNNITNPETDTRLKLRFGFNSNGTIYRQLLLTKDSRASLDYDWGFDAKNIDNQIDDMYWMINEDRYIIQGVNELNEQSIFPVGIHTKRNGLNSFSIDKIENAPSNLNIYLHDKELGIYQDLKENNYEIIIPAGTYLDRFEITFSNGQILSNNVFENTLFKTHYSIKNKSIIINNPISKQIESVEILNILGQSLIKFQTNTNKTYLEYNIGQIKTGNYILKIKTEFGLISKKILIK